MDEEVFISDLGVVIQSPKWTSVRKSISTKID